MVVKRLVSSVAMWLLLLAGTGASVSFREPADRWECDAVRNRMIRLARPYLTAEQRILYKMGVDKKDAPIFCMLTKEEAKCVYGAKSYGAARRCQARPVIDIPAVPDDRADVEVDASYGAPFPPGEDLSALAGAATFEIVVEDSSDSAKASARLASRVAALLAPVKLKPARRGEAGDVTFRFVLRGTGVGLPYENLDTKKVRTQYTAGVLEGEVTVTAGGQTLATRRFDDEQAPLSFDYKTRRFDAPSDAPFGEMFESQSGPFARLLDLVLVARGPEAHFAILAARKQPGMLDYYARERIETSTPPAIEAALQAALKDKRPAVRESAQKGLARLQRR